MDYYHIEKEIRKTVIDEVKYLRIKDSLGNFVQFFFDYEYDHVDIWMEVPMNNCDLLQKNYISEILQEEVHIDGEEEFIGKVFFKNEIPYAARLTEEVFKKGFSLII